MIISYSKDQRKEAREQNRGLFTIAYVNPDGSSVALQGLTTPKTLKFVKEAQAELIGTKE